MKIGGRAFAHIAQFHPELTALRRDLHAHPELGFEERYTAARVKEALRVCGVDEIHEGLIKGDLSPAHFAGYGAAIRQGVENMRKLVYAFYDPGFSFGQVIKRYPDAAAEITDCLSGDVNKDFSLLWSRIREFVPLPDDLPYGVPLAA